MPTMKKLIHLLLPLVLMLCFFTEAEAQVPKVIPYQGVARDAGGAIVPNRAISLRFRLRDITDAGAVIYEETQSVTTNIIGSFTAYLGQGAVTIGSMSTINWGTNAKYLQVEMDINGGVSFVDMGTRQLFSVPYALYSNAVPGWTASAGDVKLENGYNRVGIGVASPVYKLEVGDRMRIRNSSLGNLYSTPGIWLDDYRNGNTTVFTGMQDSIRWGVYGMSGTYWGLNYNTKTGNMNVGNFLGDSYRLALSGNDYGLGLYNASNEFYGGITSNNGNLVIRSSYGSPIYSPINGLSYTPPKNIIINPPNSSIYNFSYPGGMGINVDSPTAKFHVNGNVMIGAGNPASGYQLSVNGKIIAEEIKVQLNGSWPDYVFEKKYSLTSLHDLNNYIQKNKHLPNIPAAAEMEQQGLELGNMQTKLVEKIEELTLYIIELQKQIDELKKSR